MRDGRPLVVRGTVLVLVALPLVLAGAWAWPASFEADRFGRDVALAAIGMLLFAGAAACVWTGALRALQGLALGRAPVVATISGHRRLRIRRPTGADGADEARYYLRIDREGHRPVGVRVEPDDARRFHLATPVSLWKLGPAASIEVGDGDVEQLSGPCLPFPRETESV